MGQNSSFVILLGLKDHLRSACYLKFKNKGGNMGTHSGEGIIGLNANEVLSLKKGQTLYYRDPKMKIWGYVKAVRPSKDGEKCLVRMVSNFTKRPNRRLFWTHRETLSHTDVKI